MAKQIAIDIDITGTKDVLDLQKAIRNTKKELKETQDVDAYDNLAKDLVKLNSQLKEARKRQRQAVDAFTATDKSVAAYSRLSAQLRVARTDLKNLSAEGKTSGAQFDKLTKEVGQLDTQLKDIDDSVGQANRKIGDYENAIRRATGLTEKQTGAFQRATGKLNVLKGAYKDVVIAQGATSKGAIKLKKDIDKLERSLKKAGDTGKKAGKRIGGIRTQIRGVGPAAAGLATSFLIFAELPQALSDINEGFRDFAAFISPAEAANRAFGESLISGASELATSKQELNSHFAAIRNSEEGTQEYTDSVERATEAFPFLNDELIQNAFLNGEVEKAQDLATDALVRNIAEQQTAVIQDKLINQFAEKTANTFKIQADAAQTSGKVIDGVTGSIGKSIISLGGPLASLASFFGGVSTEYSDVAQALNEESIASAKEQLENLPETEKELIKNFESISKTLDGILADGQAQAAADKAERDKKAADKAEETAEKAAQRTEARRKKDADRAVAAARKQAQRLAEQRAKNQERFLEQESKDANTRANLLLSLSAQLVTAEIKNREEGEQKQIALEVDATQKRIARLNEQNAQFKAKTEERIKESAKLFGVGSDETLALEKKLGAEQLKVKKQIDGLIIQEGVASQTRTENIKKGFTDKEAKEEEKRLADFKASEQKFLDAQKKALDESVKLEKEAAEKKSEIRQKNTQITLETASKLTGFADDLAQASSDRRLARLDEEATERAVNIEGLTESLQSASGLEKEFLKQQIQRETKAAGELAAKRERIEKDAAINNKAIAVTQAIINTALAVTAQLSVPVGGFALAAIAAALGAVEIATIIAQPLATGGIVGNAQNIPTQSNGDNVLTTLTRGEVVLNKGQQARLGGSKTFANIGVPGFANGGIISPPLGAPALGSFQSDSGGSMGLLNKMSEMIEATNNRIDRIEVEYTTNTGDAIDADKQDRKEIKNRSRL